MLPASTTGGSWSKDVKGLEHCGYAGSQSEPEADAPRLFLEQGQGHGRWRGDAQRLEHCGYTGSQVEPRAFLYKGQGQGLGRGHGRRRRSKEAESCEEEASFSFSSSGEGAWSSEGTPPQGFRSDGTPPSSRGSPSSSGAATEGTCASPLLPRAPKQPSKVLQAGGRGALEAGGDEALQLGGEGAQPSKHLDWETQPSSHAGRVKEPQEEGAPTNPTIKHKESMRAPGKGTSGAPAVAPRVYPDATQGGLSAFHGHLRLPGWKLGFGKRRSSEDQWGPKGRPQEATVPVAHQELVSSAKMLQPAVTISIPSSPKVSSSQKVSNSPRVSNSPKVGNSPKVSNSSRASNFQKVSNSPKVVNSPKSPSAPRLREAGRARSHTGSGQRPGRAGTDECSGEDSPIVWRSPSKGQGFGEVRRGLSSHHRSLSGDQRSISGDLSSMRMGLTPEAEHLIAKHRSREEAATGTPKAAGGKTRGSRSSREPAKTRVTAAQSSFRIGASAAGLGRESYGARQGHTRRGPLGKLLSFPLGWRWMAAAPAPSFLEQVMAAQGKPNFKADYQLGTKLGEGGYGIVKKCIDLVTGEALACKLVSKRRLVRPKDVLKAKMEFVLLRTVGQHGGVVEVRDMYEDDEYFFMIMELCSGGDLCELLLRENVLKEEQAAGIFVQILEAVAFCHANNVVHRDLKLENILVKDRTGPGQLCRSLSVSVSGVGDVAPVVKISDFGSAVLLPHGGSASGMTGGSLMYQAPEVLRGEQHDFKADMWSLGVILFALLSRSFPFSAPTEAMLASRIQRGLFSFSAPQWDRVSEEAKHVVTMLLHTDPSLRPSATCLCAQAWVARHSKVDKTA